MRNYSDKDNSVRVDFFKPNGKWYATEAVEMPDTEETFAGLLPDVLIAALVAHLTAEQEGRIRYAGMWAVCLDPYNRFSHPQMVKVPEVASYFFKTETAP
jgi:hypothetical protein